MNNKEQQANLRGRINGSNLETEVTKPNFEADLRGFQKPQLGKSKKKIILGIISALIIILVGAVVVLATGLWNPDWNPFQPSSDQVLAEAFENMSGLKAVHSKIVYNMDVQAEESFSAGVIMESDTNTSDTNNPKFQSIAEVNVSAKGIKMFFNGEMRSIDDAFYFKIGTVPIALSATLSLAGIDISDWTNKWFKFDSKELGMSLIKTLSSEEKIEMEQDTIRLLSEYPIAVVVKKLTDEKINGQNTYHYLLALDKENVKQFLVGSLEIVNKYYEIDDLMDIPEEEMQEISDKIDEFFEKTGGIDFEIWIGKKDKLIYKVAGQKSFDLSALESGEEGTLSLGFDMFFSKFNEPAKILAPKDSQSIIEMLTPIMQIFMGGNAGGELPDYELPFPVQ
ncbi:MAG: hypothetical protein U9R01_08000 [candidate division WOR-3 bacterium]|nr:hypothetical protein [candidate division WOR-3 bacterium]